MRIIGIVNITPDSFSDGGRFLAPERAVAQGRELLADGAAILDLGAESTHPSAERISANEELARLTPVVQTLLADGASISIDTTKPAVMRAMIKLGVDYINDVTALADPAAVAAVRDAHCRLILMHAIRLGDANDARAQGGGVSAATIIDSILSFFRERIDTLTAAGIDAERIIVDPGMGMFLSPDPTVSIAVLRDWPRLRELGRPILLGVSRKSFIGGLLADSQGPRPVGERSAGTLAAELFAANAGVDFLRTHDARQLRDALNIWEALRSLRG